MVKPTAEVTDAEFEGVGLLEDLVLNISPNQFMDFIVFWSSPKLLSFHKPTAAQKKGFTIKGPKSCGFVKLFRVPAPNYWCRLVFSALAKNRT
jgi:hypothetical protein